MEFFIYILIAIIYLIIQVRAAKKKQQQQQQTGATLPPAFPGDPARTQEEVSLEDALREIRKSLGMETPSLQSPTDPADSRTTEPPREKLQPRDFNELPSTFADADFENRPTAFGKLPSIHKREQVPARSQVPARTQVPRSALEKKAAASSKRKSVKANINAPEVERGSKSAGPAPNPDNLRDLLQDPEEARKAFILGEVLGPPRAHRAH